MFATNSIQPNQNPRFLYIILLIATEKGTGDKHYFQHMSVSQTPQEAATKALDTIKQHAPDIWEIAMANGGFKVIANHNFTFESLKKMFDVQLEEKPADLAFKIVQAEEPESEKNKLIKRIIGQGDLEQLKTYKDELTEYEYKYIKEQIKYASKSSNANG